MGFSSHSASCPNISGTPSPIPVSPQSCPLESANKADHQPSTPWSPGLFHPWPWIICVNTLGLGWAINFIWFYIPKSMVFWTQQEKSMSMNIHDYVNDHANESPRGLWPAFLLYQTSGKYEGRFRQQWKINMGSTPLPSPCAWCLSTVVWFENKEPVFIL